MDSSSSMLLVLAINCISSSLSYSYDHQEEDYYARFKPSTCYGSCTVTPFFSPEHSMDVYLSLIEEAKETINLFEPSFSGWSMCTGAFGDTNDCIGCPMEEHIKEEFPIFSALINAANIRGVTIRFVTNDNDDPRPICTDNITPLDWMVLVGMKIKYYRTTTFMDAKFMSIDSGRKVLLSSVDFNKASFTENREAGIVISNCHNCDVIDLFKKVFQNDFDTGYDYLLSHAYSPEEMQYITREIELPSGKKGPYVVRGAFISDLTPVERVKIRFGYVTPDNARNTLLQTLKTVRKSIKIHIYQIKSMEICDWILSMIEKGIDVQLLVSNEVYDDGDMGAAQQCYYHLCHDDDTSKRNGTVRNTYNKFRYSHQNYWIIDDTMVMLSTGDWNPSSYPEGEIFKPYTTSNVKVSRDMVVAMDSPRIVEIYNRIFSEDWARGLPWTYVHEHDDIVVGSQGGDGTSCPAGSSSNEDCHKLEAATE